jgi:hypothetical protein
VLCSLAGIASESIRVLLRHYALADGLLALESAMRSPSGRLRGLLLLEAAISGSTAVAMVVLLGHASTWRASVFVSWAVLSGAAKLLFVLWWNTRVRAALLLGLSGTALAAVGGLAGLLLPYGVGTAARGVGAVSLVAGAMLMEFGFRLHRI